MGVGTRQLRNKKWTNCISLKVLNNGILYILSTIQKKGEGRRSERRERRIRKKKRKSKEEREEGRRREKDRQTETEAEAEAEEREEDIGGREWLPRSRPELVAESHGHEGPEKRSVLCAHEENR